MPELGPYGSVRGARGNSRPYRESNRLTVKTSLLTQNGHSLTGTLYFDARRGGRVARHGASRTQGQPAIVTQMSGAPLPMADIRLLDEDERRTTKNGNLLFADHDPDILERLPLFGGHCPSSGSCCLIRGSNFQKTITPIL